MGLFFITLLPHRHHHYHVGDTTIITWRFAHFSFWQVIGVGSHPKILFSFRKRHGFTNPDDQLNDQMLKDGNNHDLFHHEADPLNYNLIIITKGSQGHFLNNLYHMAFLLLTLPLFVTHHSAPGLYPLCPCYCYCYYVLVTGPISNRMLEQVEES